MKNLKIFARFPLAKKSAQVLSHMLGIVFQSILHATLYCMGTSIDIFLHVREVFEVSHEIF